MSELVIRSININNYLLRQKFNEFKMCVSYQKRERLERFHQLEDALRSLYGELLVRDYIVREYHMPNEEIQYFEEALQKPYIKNLPDVKFNISHAGDWAVCIIHDHEVGIDIERISKNPAVESEEITRNFFHEKELESLLAVAPEERSDYFFDLWTLKESFVKYKGKGLSIPLNSFCVKKENGAIQLFTETSEPVFFKQYKIDKGYKLTVCAETELFPKLPDLVHIDSLFS